MIINGIEYCDKCKTPKQVIRTTTGTDMTLFPIRCECEEREYQARKQAELKAQQEFELRMQAEKLRNNGIAVKQYHSWTLENDDNRTPQLTAKIKTYINGFENKYKPNGIGLLLYGDIGTGKTYYAMCIANALVDKGYKVYTTSLSQVARIMREWNKQSARFNALMSYDLIVIDDLGTESSTPTTMETFYDFIDGCTSRNIPLIVTTNLSLKMLEQVRDGGGNLDTARICSRILEKCYPILINSVKRRNLKAEQNKAMLDKDFK